MLYPFAVRCKKGNFLRFSNTLCALSEKKSVTQKSIHPNIISWANEFLGENHPPKYHYPLPRKPHKTTAQHLKNKLCSAKTKLRLAVVLLSVVLREVFFAKSIAGGARRHGQGKATTTTTTTTE